MATSTGPCGPQITLPASSGTDSQLYSLSAISMVTMLTIASPYWLLRQRLHKPISAVILLMCLIYWHKLYRDAVDGPSTGGNFLGAIVGWLSSAAAGLLQFLVPNVALPVLLQVLEILKALCAYCFDCVIYLITG